ncbi:hypothetical protein ABZ682_19480 [Streptomyces griseoviridis]|uniref:hypothetical protein n=1 Tax=Streptomyces griseoviridis TaxID=45398 RepID=UPI00341091C8
MEIRGIDPRDISWEQDHADYRVYFWDRSSNTSHEYEILDQVDIGELLTWTRQHAAEHGWTYTLYAVADDDGRRGLIRLAGVLDDPFA